MTTVKQFLQYLAESKLFSDEELRALIDRMDPDDLAKDARELAAELVLQKRLTSYQANAIYQGHPQRLVIGTNYVIQELIGTGGMGMVFKAQHRRMKREVALKVLTSHAMHDEEAIRRFYQEVEVAATLDHRNIVRAYDADESKGVHYLVMEYVRGNDLQEIVQREGSLSVGQAVNCMIQAAQGLAHAHKNNVIHRDIKPANLLMNSDGLVKILDMGLARINNPLSDVEAVDKGLTMPGSIMGTVDFMAPEQAADAKKADGRSDIYSLGCTLFYLLTGRPVYDGETAMIKLLSHRESDVPSLQSVRDDVSPELDAVFQKLVAKQPPNRFQSMGEVIEALTPCRTESEAETRESVTQYLAPDIRGGILEGFQNTTTGKTSGTKIQKPGETVDSSAPLDSAPLPPSALDVISSTVRRDDHWADQLDAQQFGGSPKPVPPGTKKQADERPLKAAPVSRDNSPSIPQASGVQPTSRIRLPLSEAGQTSLLIGGAVLGIGAGLAVLLWATAEVAMGLLIFAAIVVLFLMIRSSGSKQPVPAGKPATLPRPANAPATSPTAPRRPALPAMKVPQTGEEDVSDESEPTLQADLLMLQGKLADLEAERFNNSPAEKPKSAPGSFTDLAQSATASRSITLRRLLEADQAEIPDRLIAPFNEALATQHRQEWAEFLGVPPEVVNSVGTRMVLVPAGEFLMGSPLMEEGHSADEKQHCVRLTRPFLMAVHPVTVGEFWKFVNETSYRTDAENDLKGGYGFDSDSGKIFQSRNFSWRHPGFAQTDQHPVVNVTWKDALAFCQWLSQRERITYRLPTEAEWEYACRAGTESRYSCGDDPESLVTVGNVADGSTKVKFPHWPTISSFGGYVFTAPVQSFEPNAFGISDLHGNVWEWCNDLYGKDYYSQSPLTDPEGPTEGNTRVLRGGSWMNAPMLTRSAKRLKLHVGYHYLNNGFRLATTP